MLRYNQERNKIKEARQQIYRDFALKYGEIKRSELSESEKQDKINELLENTRNSESILSGIRNMSELSDEEKEILGINSEDIPTKVDQNVVNALVSIYAQRARISKTISGSGILDRITPRDGEQLEEIDTTAFEEDLRQFFTEHYSDLIDSGYNDFLSEATEVKEEGSSFHDKNGELIEIAIKNNMDPEKFRHFGYQLTIQDGLVAEEDHMGTNVFYAGQEGINRRIYDLYSVALFQDLNSKNVIMNIRELKNDYITYAETHGIEIQDKDVFEEIPVDMDKVQGIASYINRVLNETGKISTDMTAVFAAEIQSKYSKIMNLDSFSFGKLETVKEATGDAYTSSLLLSIKEDSIERLDIINPDIAYGTPEYIKTEYESIMRRIKGLSSTDTFLEGTVDVAEANRRKDVLRRYITENGIEGIDISIPEVEIDHNRTEMIADAILKRYGAKHADQEGMKARILKKIEDRYAEMFYERQVIGLADLVGEELKEMGERFVMKNLYMQSDFVYIGDHFGGECIYATPEAILEKIKVLDNRIMQSKFNLEEKRSRESLVQYAKNNKFEIEIPDLESVENSGRRELDAISFRGNGLSFSRSEQLSDDPTARKKIEPNDTLVDVMAKISEGNPGAMVGMSKILQTDEAGFILLLGLDDMNIRGSQVWIAYKYLYNEDAKKFTEAVKRRDPKMVDFINEELASVGEEKAVVGGASFDRNKTPGKYRFTAKEVEELKQQREERIAREKEQRKKMLANSPAKKDKGAKKREERENKRQEYRQKLIAKGKKSLGELDEELTELQQREEQAKKLYAKYEVELPDQEHDEL